MDSNFINSLSGILAVTLVDYIYIILSLIGIGNLLKKNGIKKKIRNHQFGHTGSIRIDDPA